MILLKCSNQHSSETQTQKIISKYEKLYTGGRENDD